MQILDHHQATEFNMMELGGIMLLGVLMEGVIQPYWSSMIKERIKSAHDVSLPRVQVRLLVPRASTLVLSAPRSLPPCVSVPRHSCPCAPAPCVQQPDATELVC